MFNAKTNYKTKIDYEGENFYYDLELVSYQPEDHPPYVTLYLSMIYQSDGSTESGECVDLSSDQARELGQKLIEAADKLEGSDQGG